MLTHKQRQTLVFIQRYFNEHGEAPTVREIAAGIKISSPGVVHRYVAALVEAGAIYLEEGRHRNIRLSEVTSDEDHFKACLPILGRIAAGQPIEAVADSSVFDFSESLLGEGRFLLQVKGDSMIGDNICDGDYIICEHCEQTKAGEIAVILIDNENVTLKRYYHAGDSQIRLQPSNPSLKAQYYEAARLKIQGRYLGLLRLAH